MLVKVELSKTSPLECPKAKKGGERAKSFVCAAKIENVPKCGRVLVADVFDRKSRELKLRFFSDGQNAILCKEWPAKEWFFKLTRSLLGSGGIELSEETEKLIHKFLFPDDSGRFTGYYYGYDSPLDKFIGEIYADKQQKAQHRKYEKMKEHFAMFPAYPADLPEYCERHIFKTTYIFADKLIKDRRKCLCGHCGKSFELGREKAIGTMTVCPKCGKAGRMRGSWIGFGVTETAKICIAHKADNQLLLRWANVSRTFCAGGSKHKYRFDDYYYSLYLNTPKNRTIYAYAFMAVMGCGWDWFRKQNGDVNYKPAHIYADNLGEVFGETYYHVNLEKGLRGSGELSFAGLLDNLKNIPAAEYLFKLGLTRLASEMSKHDSNSGTGAQALGINMQYLPLYRRFNVTRYEHNIISAAKTWVSEESFAKFRALRFDGQSDDIIELLGEMSFERFANYFTKQKAVTKHKNSRMLITWYKDYIDMSRSLKVDLSHKSVRFPGNIKTAHDLIVQRFNKVKHEIEDANFIHATAALYAGLSEYAKGDYCIVFPRTRSEFFAEGQSLGHCVGGESYYKNHIEGKRMIFFVRRADAPEKPFYTMEIDMRGLRILQIHGYKHCSATQEVRSLANEFLRRLSPMEVAS